MLLDSSRDRLEKNNASNFKSKTGLAANPVIKVADFLEN